MSDSKGDIWVMLNDEGFARITHTPIHVRPENILPDNRGFYPTSLYDKIFVATVNGLAFLDLRTLKGVIFRREDGMPDEPISTLRFAADSSDKSIWFACRNILCNISTTASSNYRQPPALAISEVSVINDTVLNYPPATISLRHDQNDLRLSFSAINYIDPENMRFAYRIKNGNDSSWIEAGNQPNILLTNISPGKYIVQAKVYAFDNKWPEQVKEMEIVIRPPFWNTWWFYAIAILATLTCIFLFYRHRIAQVRKQARIDRQMAEYEIKALHAQMNPHFVFNCLNSIKEMILHDEKQNASRYLSKFAQLIRTNLEESRQGFITVKQCIDHLEQYIEMEKIRFDQFNYNIDTEPGLPLDARMAPMIVQPLVENAIWHGLQKGGGEKNLNIRFYRSGTQLVCEIEDNGIGIIQSQKNKLSSRPAHRSMGITNIEERIAVLNEKYKMNCSLTISDKSELSQKDGSGTLAILKLNM